MLFFMQISVEHNKDKGFLEVDVDLLEGEEATTFHPLRWHLIQHTLPFIWSFSAAFTTKLQFNRHLYLHLPILDLLIPRVLSGTYGLLFLYLFCFTLIAQANAVLMLGP